MIKYAHRRLIDPNTGHTAGKGGITIAYERIDENTIAFAVARCHERDNFCKMQGRVKSAGRLKSNKHRTIFQGSVQAFKELAYKIPLNFVGNL